ncbi:MAG: hypothetical protein A4E35_01104 [Methanoregula sp. PtaU1.Bin051]|nr:MAG: hypothetical protein A4E35_01104 [Methanoregula sp. PtaU1.Bin051]
MEGAARVFAGEFCRATYRTPVHGKPGVSLLITCGGARCNRVFLTGTLTEVSDVRGMLRCRLADPTGAFDLEMVQDGKSTLPDTVRKIEIPSFLAVVGRVQVRNGSAGLSPFIRPESVWIVDRTVRDTWVLQTAGITLRRIRALISVLNGQDDDADLKAVIDYYHTSEAGLLELVAMVESALSGVRSAPAGDTEPVQDVRAIIIQIIRDMQGSRGVAVDDVVAQAGLYGIDNGRAQETVRELIREDECYQPQKGTVRLL